MLIAAVLSGFGLAVVAPWLYRLLGRATGWILALLPLALFVYFATLLNPATEAGGLLFSYPWIPTLGINLSFYVDGLSLLFALIISGVGALIVLYGSGYLAGDPAVNRFFVYILIFMASMLGLVLASNVITLFVFWELTSISSFLLIGYYHEREESRFAALQALLVTGGGGLALLAGLVLLGLAGGSWEIATLLDQGAVVQAHPLYLGIVILVLAGAFTKSAQFPFHFWLPGAMAAPAPVSAYLHSATMVKAGVYLVARLNPVLGGTETWQVIVTAFGAVTMLLGAYIAWQQTDLKRILAYSTVSALGTLMLLLGLGDHIAFEAAIVFLVVHSLYKGALFMVAGAVDHETGTRFVDQLGGLRRVMPFTTGAAVLAGLSMAGMAPFLGFVGKELIYEATLESELGAYLFTALAVLANALTIVAAGLAAYRPFFGRPVETPKHAHEAPLSMWLGPVLLAALGLMAGVLVYPFGLMIISPAVAGIAGEVFEVKLALWHGINTMLILSIITIIAGVGMYWGREPLLALVRPLNIITRWGPEQGYNWALEGMMTVAKVQTRLLQSGYLRHYLLMIMTTTVAIAGYTLVTQGGLQESPIWQTPDTRLHELMLYGTILAATAVVVTTSSRLTAVAALGTIGFGMALIFILYGAPDLAMTQFSIETLSVILLVLVLYRLPRFTVFSSRQNRIRDWIVAATAGGLVTLLILVVTALPTSSRLTPYFAETSLLLANGHNVVNVILVDYRGFDTMGEITVLGIAAIGVYALLYLRLGKNQSEAEETPAERAEVKEIYPAPLRSRVGLRKEE